MDNKQSTMKSVEWVFLNLVLQGVQALHFGGQYAGYQASSAISMNVEINTVSAARPARLGIIVELDS